MILGIDTDILDIRRIDKIFYKHGQVFIERIFGINEIEMIPKKNKHIELLDKIKERLSYIFLLNKTDPIISTFKQSYLK